MMERTTAGWIILAAFAGIWLLTNIIEGTLLFVLLIIAVIAALIWGVSLAIHHLEKKQSKARSIFARILEYAKEVLEWLIP